MIEGLDCLLEGSGEPGLAELRETLRAMCNGPATTGKVIAQQRLKPCVLRLRIEADGQVHSLVIKRLKSNLARRNQLVVQRWLPAIGLGERSPRLLGVAAQRSGRYVWHVYEDLGDWGLDPKNSDPRRVRAAVALIAQVHTRAAEHSVLPECRKYAGDLGIYFFTSNVRDALRALEALRPPDVELSSDHLALRNRLLERMYKLLDEQPYRARLMEELGGPETLLHGDLWAANALVLPTTDGLEARLIDWDHVGVGPFSYDLSTFLYRFPPHDRQWILDCYRESVERAGWRLPSARDLNVLFDTAECARYACCAIWPAIALREDHGEWGFEALAEIERWFETLEPMLPGTGQTTPESSRRPAN